MFFYNNNNILGSLHYFHRVLCDFFPSGYFICLVIYFAFHESWSTKYRNVLIPIDLEKTEIHQSNTLQHDMRRSAAANIEDDQLMTEIAQNWPSTKTSFKKNFQKCLPLRPKLIKNWGKNLRNWTKNMLLPNKPSQKKMEKTLNQIVSIIKLMAKRLLSVRNFVHIKKLE